MVLIFKKAAFPDAGLMKLLDISGTFHTIRRTTAGNYIDLNTEHVLVKIETESFILLVS